MSNVFRFRPRVVGAAVVAALAAAVVALPAPRPVAAQAKAEIPADLALVHPDALGFVHVRLADVWKHDSLKDVRKLFEKAGAKPLAALDTQFVLKPSAVDRVTAILLPPDRGEPGLVTVMRFTAPIDAAALKKAYLTTGKDRKAGKKDIFADEAADLAVHFPDDRTVAFSDPKTLTAYLTWAPKPDGGLRDAVTLAGSGKPVVAAVNIARVPFPPGIEDFLPEEIRPLLKAKVLTVSADLAKAVTLDARLTFAAAGDAAAGEKALRKGAEMARGLLAEPRKEVEDAIYGKKNPNGARRLDELPGAIAAVAALGGLNVADEILADPPLKTDGTAVTATVTLPEWATQFLGAGALGSGLALPAAQKVRAAAARTKSMNNLKQIGLAMHNYESTFQTLPPAAIMNKKKEKLLSWRVTILPYIEQDALYRQFKLDEPWDSENNKALISKMPQVYADPRLGDIAAQIKEGKTYYKAFVGKDAVLDWTQSRTIVGITDGSSNTLLVAAGGDPVIWSKPDDFEFDAEKAPPDLSKPFDAVLAVFADGHVQTLSKNMQAAKTLKALITAAGGEVVDFD